MEEVLRQLIERIDRLERELKETREKNYKITIDGDTIECPACKAELRLDGKYRKVNTFDDVIDLLRARHGDHDLSFLECPNCKPKFMKLLRDLGYDVYERGKQIIIRRK